MQSAPKHPDFEARAKRIRAIEKQAGWDWQEDRNEAAHYAADSVAYYAYTYRQALLTQRWLRGDRDGYEL